MRDKLRKRIALSAVTALTLFAAVPVYADTYDAVYDDATLLSDEEQQSLSEEITNLQETTGWEVYVLTTEDAQGKTAREYGMISMIRQQQAMMAWCSSLTWITERLRYRLREKPFTI